MQLQLLCVCVVSAGAAAVCKAVFCPACFLAPVRRQRPEYIPATTLGQLMRWSAVALSQLFRGSVDLGALPTSACIMSAASSWCCRRATACPWLGWCCTACSRSGPSTA